MHLHPVASFLSSSCNVHKIVGLHCGLGYSSMWHSHQKVKEIHPASYYCQVNAHMAGGTFSINMSSFCWGRSLQRELIGSRWEQLWWSGGLPALGANPAGLALAKVTFAGRVFQTLKLEVYILLLFSRYSINIKEWIWMYLVRFVFSVLFYTRSLITFLVPA